jgi:hypothetical protein
MTLVLKKLPAKKQKLMPIIAALSFIFISYSQANAQTKVLSALMRSDSTGTQHASIDSLGVHGSRIKIISDLHAKSGSLAMLLSALLPGAGQVYAHRYYTLPVWWGFGIYFGSIANNANNRYLDYRGKFSESVRLDTAKHTGDPYLLNARDFYRDQRDEFLLYLGLTYFLNIIDAYVGAVLYDFDVSDELGGSAKIQVRVPLHE